MCNPTCTPPGAREPCSLCAALSPRTPLPRVEISRRGAGRGHWAMPQNNPRWLLHQSEAARQSVNRLTSATRLEFNHAHIPLNMPRMTRLPRSKHDLIPRPMPIKSGRTSRPVSSPISKHPTSVAPIPCCLHARARRSPSASRPTCQGHRALLLCFI